jgi:hypothetical protein
MIRGTTLRKNGSPVIESESPLVCWLRRAEDRLELRGHLELASMINLRVASKPRDVRLNGQPARDYSYNSKTRSLHLSIPAGSFIIQAVDFETL